MTGTAITTDVDVANITLLGQTINPGIGLSLGVPGVLAGARWPERTRLRTH